MRVIQLGKYYSPHKGGIETHLDVLCRSLKASVDVEAIVFNDVRKTVHEMVEGIPVTRCGALMTIASSPMSPMMAWELSKRRYDVLHLHTPNPMATAAYLASKKPLRHGVVVTHHSDIIRQARLKQLIGPMMRKMLERADAILVSSPNYLDSSRELEPFREKCRIVPFGIDLKWLEPNAEARRLGEEIRSQIRKPIVLSVGRISYYKGFEVAVEAMQSIDATLVIVGDGPLRSSLEAQARLLGVSERVVFAGHVPDRSLLPYYLAADVFVLASIARSEAFGIVQLEAMACRIPVVNTELDSGVPFVSRHGDSGLTVPPGDAGALGAAINQLLGDPGLRRRYGERGRARVESDFSAQAMSAAILRTYREVATARAVPVTTSQRGTVQGPDTKRMRVVELGKYYYPHMGGIETHLDLLCRKLRPTVDVEAVVFNTNQETARETVEGVPVTRCGTLFTVASSPVSPAMAWELSKRRYDVLHLHTPNPLAAAAYLASRKPRRHALVVTHHSDIVRQARLKRLVSPVMQRVLERADAILVTSPNYLASSKELEPFRDKCRVVPYGLNLDELVPDADALDAAARIRAEYPGPIVLSVGRLIYYKGFEVAIEAMQEIAATLLLVGEGPLHDSLKASVRTLGVEKKVAFIGEVHNRSLLPYYLAADVFVLASVARSEAFGIVQLEAMACGVPVVNTALDSGVPFVSRDGESGLTVTPGDAAGLAAAIRQLLGDASLRATYGKGGRTRVAADFSVDAMSSEILSVYRDVSGADDHVASKPA